MKILNDKERKILLCDSWYPKGSVLKTVESYELLFLKFFGAKFQNIKKIKAIYINCKSAIKQNLAS